MKRSIIFVLALWVAGITTAALAALAAPSPPTRTVERLSFARESAAEQSTQFTLRSVKCAPTHTAYVYVCNFTGTSKLSRKPLCAATYVHYHPRHTGRYSVNFWGQSWSCGSKPPLAPPAYPGDGPSS